MKKIIKFLTPVMVIALVVSCSKGSTSTTPALVTSNATLSTKTAKADNSINTATLPQSVLDYIKTNYPNETVTSSDVENNGNYEVTLSSGTELIFDSKGAFLGIDDDGSNDFGDTKILPSNLPQTILDFITANYPSSSITKAELENNGHYEVKLNDGTELVFDANGVFLGQGVDQDEMKEGNDNNSNDDNSSSSETNIDPATLPQAVKDYISTNYPTATIMQAEKESNGNFEVTLSTGIELYFKPDGSFIKTGNGDDNGDGIGD